MVERTHKGPFDNLCDPSGYYPTAHDVLALAKLSGPAQEEWWAVSDHAAGKLVHGDNCHGAYSWRWLHFGVRWAHGILAISTAGTMATLLSIATVGQPTMRLLSDIGYKSP